MGGVIRTPIALIPLVVLAVGTAAVGQSYFELDPPGLSILGQPGITPVVYADYDGDGTEDLAMWSAGLLRCYPGVPGASFGPSVNSTLANANGSPSEPRLLGPIDLDGDGLPDLVRTGFWGLVPLISQGNGAFVEGFGPPWIVNAREADVADVDGNGTLEVVYPELFVTGFGTAVSIASYDVPTMSLVPQTTLTVPVCTGLRTGDFNGDGAVDILVVTVGPAGAPEYVVLTGNGLGTGFTTVGPFPMLSAAAGGPEVQDPLIGEFTGDGADDVLAITDVPGTYSLHAGVPSGTGPGVLANPVAVILTTNACPAVGGLRHHVADIDADGLDDLVVAGCIPAGGPGVIMRAFRSLGGGAFRPPYDTEIIPSSSFDGGPTTLAFSDGDGDGDLDVAFMNMSWLTLDIWSGFGRNRAVLGPGTGPVGGGPSPTQSITPPAPGTTVTLGLAGAQPGVTAAIGVSTGGFLGGAVAGPIWIDTSPAALILPTPAFGVFTTTASGTVSFSVSVPPSLPAGLTVHSQWIAQHPVGGVSLFGSSWTATEARTMVIY